MKEHLPDPMREEHKDFESLDAVGMEGVEALLRLSVLPGEAGVDQELPCSLRVHVSLDKKPSRGIHMSRIYLQIQKALEHKMERLQDVVQILQDVLKTHEELSTAGDIEIQFLYPITRKALKSSERGLRTYKVKLQAVQTPKGIKTFIKLRIIYSSTCPASASLSRHLQWQHFDQVFQEDTISKNKIRDWFESKNSLMATPHAQRSVAVVRLEVSPQAEIHQVRHFIDEIEEVLQTPVQGPVKREDEQEFALRNGRNLMFCEDAARRLKKYFQKQSSIFSFEAKVTHLESLHPHNAVAVIRGQKQ